MFISSYSMMGLSGYSTEHSVGAYDIYIYGICEPIPPQFSVRTSKGYSFGHDVCYKEKNPLSAFISILNVLHCKDLSQYLHCITTILIHSNVIDDLKL